MLSEEELERYARHIILRDVGGPGQKKLKAARVLVIGAGGLGSPLLSYLAAAGVGTIGIVDDDHVSLSNLQRQIIHDSESVGEPKVWSAANRIRSINPNTVVEQHAFRLTEEKAFDLIASYDLVADACDNFDTRYLLADLCEQLEKPLITAAVGQFDGSITLLKPYEVDETGQLNPRYKDLFPQRPSNDNVATCATAGIIGALPGILGSMQAMEVIKEIVGIGEGLIGRLLLCDTRSMRFETILYRRRND